MDIQVIKELMSEFKEAELTKLSLKCESFELTLEKEKEILQVSSQPMAYPTMAYSAPVSGGANEALAPQMQCAPDVKYITSPMVGTFYASSSPNGEPFVKVGSKVKKGDIVCIVEAMKLMNEVEAESDGEITEILVSNETMVEYAQPLFVIK